MSISEAKWTLAPSVLASSITSFLLLTFVRFHAEIFFQFFPFLVHCCLCCGNLHGLRHRNKFVYQIAMLQWILTFCLQYGLHDDSVKIHTQSCGFAGFQNTRKFWFDLIGFTTGRTMLTVLAGLARHRGSHWCFQLLANILDGLFKFLVLRVNEIISRSFLALSSWGFSCDHFCFSLGLAFLPILIQRSGHKWCGLDVNCRGSVSPDHIYPSGGFSSNRIKWVKPVQESDKSLDPSSMRRSCLTSKFVCVVLETSMYFCGRGNGSSLGE